MVISTLCIFTGNKILYGDADCIMASWSSWRAFDSNVIDAVRSKPVLYNTRLKEFSSNKIKENAWKAVAAEVGASGK